jgi:putative solute:sodium symporter small subunit
VPLTRDQQDAYWRANLRLLGGCLAVWFCTSFGGGILLVDVLNRWHFGGAPLGFWIAQQGSIYLFLLLVVFYGWRMRRLDARFGFDER